MEVDPEFKEDDELKESDNFVGFPIPRELMFREMGYNSFNRTRNIIGKKLVSDTLASSADYNMVACNKKLNTKTKFKLPSGARTTFHMAFSGDGKLVASCHGDHNVYVCEIKSGKVLKTLSGHPRTPWCVVFHPTQSDILASGCLSGHVRVWDLKGGSELLITDSGTVIASLAFHPTVRLLAIGTFNEVLFWDWSKGDVPLARCCTENNKEKVRLVRFDASGRSLITGITNFPIAPPQNPIHTSVFQPPPHRQSINLLRNIGDLDLDPDLQEELEERQDRFQESYRQLVNHYEDLVQHYHSFLRSRIPRILGVGASFSSDGNATSQIVTSRRDEVVDDESMFSEPIPGPSTRSGPNPQSMDHGRLTPRTSLFTAHMFPSQSPNASASSPASANNTPVETQIQSSTSNSTSREFSSIEALAQNIMEMQNLCSQARQRVRLGPPTMETQHVMELQQIRQHLEVLQDQTRRLQHSIRATLTSLATGSLAALRSQDGTQNASVTNTTNTASTSASNLLNLHTSTHPSPSSNSQTPITSIMANVAASAAAPLSIPVVAPHSSNSHNSNSDEPRPRRSISPSTSSSTSFFRISINSSPDRMRVPPVVRYNDNRRVVTREFIIDHHSRNCPFNLNQQPPQISNRTRCLIEDEGQIALETWPTMETGLETSTRSFAGVEIVRREDIITPNADINNLRVFLTVRGADDVEMSENWQRNFLSGLALVPSAVREGRRGRNIRIRRNYLRSQVPNRLNNSFVRSFYIRVDADLVPVYSSHETTSSHEIRDSLGSNVFVFPIGVFFNDFDSNQQIGIYWPCMNQGEEEALSDVRRFEQAITVYPNQNSGGRRVRVSYDSNSLDIEVGGIRLGIVQPGVQVLEAVTNLRSGGTRGVIYVEYLAPLLEGMERYFSQQFLGHNRGRRRTPRRIITFARDNGQSTSGSSSFEFRSGAGMSRSSQFHEGPGDDDNRRVLSLAVETAASSASELLINRRPVESRIERVLNSSNVLHNMGPSRAGSNEDGIVPSMPNPSGGASSMTNQERLDDIQRRISLLTNNVNWPRSGRTSSTQTGSSRGADEGLNNRSQGVAQHHHWVIRRQRRFTNQPVQRPVDSGTSARTRASTQAERGERNYEEEASRYLHSYNPEILITPRATLNGAGSSASHAPPTGPPSSSSYYHLDTGNTFLSSRVQKWDFSEFVVPDISQRNTNIVVRECSLHSDACLDVSKNSEFLAVLQPSDSGAYSSLGVYSLKDEDLGVLLYVYHFDQNTVSVSVSPSSEYVVVGYAGRGPMYRFVQQGNRNIGQILSLRSNTRNENRNRTLAPIRDLYVENTGSVMAINCMHFLPVPGMGIVYGTNTGELVKIS